MVNYLIQIFYYPMHGHTNWLYVIDVAPRAVRVLQDTQELSSIDEVNRVLDTADQIFEEGGSFTEEEIDYSSTSTHGSSTSKFGSQSSLLDTFELDTNVSTYVDEIDIVYFSQCI